jgi:hypothetical protein
MYEDVEKLTWAGAKRKFFFYAGGKESESMVYDMDRMIALVQKKKNFETIRLTNPIGKHSEGAWRKEFPTFYQFILP